MNLWVQAVMWWLKTSTLSLGSPADCWNTFCGVFLIKSLFKVFILGEDAWKEIKLSHFFHAYLVPFNISLQSGWHQAMPRAQGLGNTVGSCSYVRRLHMTGDIAELLEPRQHGLRREMRLRLQKHSGQRQVRSIWSDSSSPWALELPRRSFVLVIFLAGAGSVQPSTAAGGEGVLYISTPGDTLTSFWHLCYRIPLALSLLRLNVDSQPAEQLLAFPEPCSLVLCCPRAVKVAPAAWAVGPSLPGVLLPASHSVMQS